MVLASAVVLVARSSQEFAWDYAINWTAARALREHISLYDGNALRALGVQFIGQELVEKFNHPFTSYIGLPTTAIFLLPFTFWSFPESLFLYRVATSFAYIGGVLLISGVVPVKARPVTFIAGVACLWFWHSVTFSVQLGQLDGWIVLLLALSMVAVQRGAWRVAGVGIGLATLLKISPALLLMYGILKRQWGYVGVAITTITLGLLVALIPQRGGDLATFVTRIAPSLSDGSIHIQNQSLGAWLARLAATNPQFLAFSIGIGYWRTIGLLIAGCLMLLVWWKYRTTSLSATELGVVILIALLAGPITWDHYISWAIIPFMLVLPHLQGVRRSLFVAFAVLLALPVVYIAPGAIENAWWLRIITGTQTIALLGLLSISLASIQVTSASKKAQLPSAKNR
jgi:hypothetical protein